MVPTIVFRLHLLSPTISTNGIFIVVRMSRRIFYCHTDEPSGLYYHAEEPPDIYCHAEEPLDLYCHADEPLDLYYRADEPLVLGYVN